MAETARYHAPAPWRFLPGAASRAFSGSGRHIFFFIHLPALRTVAEYLRWGGPDVVGIV
jgi:hypothetical protein